MANVQTHQQHSTQGLKDRFKINLSEWSLFERVWVVVFFGITIYLYFAFEDTTLGLISSVSGMICVVLVAKGKISNYLFGFIQASTYGYIAYTYGLYGESMLNLGFFLPIQFVGFYVWYKHKNNKEESVQGEDIYSKRLTKKGWLWVVGSFIVGAILYAELLFLLDAQQVRIDSMAVVLSVIAQILMIRQYAEQWIIWIIINVLTITLWVLTLKESGGTDYHMVVMWSAFLANSIYGYVNWLKINKGNQTNRG